MLNILLTTLFTLSNIFSFTGAIPTPKDLTSIPVAQGLPGIAFQNSFSYRGILANHGLGTIYPTGGIAFDFGGTVADPTIVTGGCHECTGLRLIAKDDVGGVGVWIGRITYATPTQINFIDDGSFCGNAQFPFFCAVQNQSGYTKVTLQRRTSTNPDVWVDISTDNNTITGSASSPEIATVYVNGTARPNGDLYVYNPSTGGYQYHKKLYDGPNPRQYNGQATIMIFYVSNVQGYGQAFKVCDSIGGASPNATHFVVNGVQGSDADIVGSGYSQLVYPGVAQINVRTPQAYTGDITFNLTSAVDGLGQSCYVPHYGNTVYINLQ